MQITRSGMRVLHAALTVILLLSCTVTAEDNDDASQLSLRVSTSHDALGGAPASSSARAPETESQTTGEANKLRDEQPPRELQSGGGVSEDIGVPLKGQSEAVTSDATKDNAAVVKPQRDDGNEANDQSAANAETVRIRLGESTKSGDKTKDESDDDHEAAQTTNQLEQGDNAKGQSSEDSDETAKADRDNRDDLQMAGASLGQGEAAPPPPPPPSPPAQSTGAVADGISPEEGKLGEGEAYIPLSPTIPKLTVLTAFTAKGLLKISRADQRQFSINEYADMSSTQNGAAIFGGNMHVLSVKSRDEFRYSNTHGQIGGVAFATNYPHYNKASVLVSGTKASTADAKFDPKVVTTFTSTGNVGVGVEGPASRLHVQGEDNTRLINVNHWGDLSACASGVGLFGGNAYVTTEKNEAMFRYANSHSGMGAIGFASNYPEWNVASVITSGTTSAQAKKSFKPKIIASFTHTGFVGIGTSRPAATLHVEAAVRQFSVNDWVDVSSQGTVGYVGLNAHMIMKGQKHFFAFSNTANSIGAIGLATNFPTINQLSVIASKEGSSSKGTLFNPTTIATFDRKSTFVGVGTDAPTAKLDVRNENARQISANKFADVSANERLQGFFGGNGYAVGQGFNFANTHAIAGAIGLATHFPKPGEAAIISSGSERPAAGQTFNPIVLAQFKSDGSMELTKDMKINGDLRVSGRILNAEDETEYDFMAAQEALVRENTMLQERVSRMETMLMELTSK